MKKFRIAGLLIIGLSFLYTPLALGEITTMGEAINKAGRQRMLTQRVLKAYFQMGMNVQYDFASKQLRSAVNLFDRQLAELQEFAPNAAIKKTLAKVKKLWVPFKAVATADVDRKKAGELRDMGEEVLRTAHKAVLQLQDSSGTSTARLVNIAGRQRMLSQRLCNLYMLLSWGFIQAEYTNDYSQAMNEFRGALTDLQDAKENTTRISQKLKEVSRQWDMFERSARLKDGEYVPLLIAMSAEKILKKMNEATGMYAELLSAR